MNLEKSGTRGESIAGLFYAVERQNSQSRDILLNGPELETTDHRGGFFFRSFEGANKNRQKRAFCRLNGRSEAMCYATTRMFPF
jgi:hypothetical protein